MRATARRADDQMPNAQGGSHADRAQRARCQAHTCGESKSGPPEGGAARRTSQREERASSGGTHSTATHHRVHNHNSAPPQAGAHPIVRRAPAPSACRYIERQPQ
eukprot:1296584-Alexandrium_andersonii.AAC.1